MTSSRALRLLLLLAFASASTPSQSSVALSVLQPFEAVEPHMGTLFRLKGYAASEAEAKAAFAAAFERIAALDAALSDYQPGSELNRITKEAIKHPVPVSEDFLRVLLAAQDLSERTDGAFDITIGPLTHLWRDARKTNQIPDKQTVAAARAKCGFRKLHVDKEKQTVLVDEAGMQLDAGAIAKGDAADEALRVLSDHGMASALVAASGDLAFSNPPPGQAGWKVGLDSLDRPDAPFTRVLLLHNAAVSTSGPGEQHINSGGKQYSHIIDPTSGIGLQKSLTVTVVSSRGMIADSYATAVSVLGAEKGLLLVDARPDTSAIILENAGGGQSHILESSHFGQLPTLSSQRP